LGILFGLPVALIFALRAPADQRARAFGQALVGSIGAAIAVLLFVFVLELLV
jgi:hypothetical protein